MNPDYELYVGRLGKKPDLRYTPKKTAVCNLSIALENRDGEATIWKRVIVWGKQAELCSLYLKKGSELFVQGQTKMRSYRDNEGNERNIEEVNARLIGFSNL